MIIIIAFITIVLVAILIAVLMLEIRTLGLEIDRLEVKNDEAENDLYCNEILCDDLVRKLSFAGKNFIEKTNELKDEIRLLKNKINKYESKKCKEQGKSIRKPSCRITKRKIG